MNIFANIVVNDDGDIAYLFYGQGLYAMQNLYHREVGIGTASANFIPAHAYGLQAVRSEFERTLCDKAIDCLLELNFNHWMAGSHGGIFRIVFFIAGAQKEHQ